MSVLPCKLIFTGTGIDLAWWRYVCPRTDGSYIEFPPGWIEKMPSQFKRQLGDCTGAIYTTSDSNFPFALFLTTPDGDSCRTLIAAEPDGKRTKAGAE